MKLIALLASLVLSVSVHAQDKTFINEAQQDKLLQVLDDACGDSWCEGEYNLDFKQLTCNAEGCTVNIDMDLGVDAESFAKNPMPRFFEANIWLAKTPAFVAQLNSDSFKHNLLIPEFQEEVDKAITAVTHGSAGKYIKTPQGLLKAINIKDQGKVLALLKNIASALEGENNDVVVYLDHPEEVCTIKGNSYVCNYSYLAGRWNGEIQIVFKFQNGWLTQILSLQADGNF